jgi:hypothetical protein
MIHALHKLLFEWLGQIGCNWKLEEERVLCGSRRRWEGNKILVCNEIFWSGMKWLQVVHNGGVWEHGYGILVLIKCDENFWLIEFGFHHMQWRQCEPGFKTWRNCSWKPVLNLTKKSTPMPYVGHRPINSRIHSWVLWPVGGGGGADVFLIQLLPRNDGSVRMLMTYTERNSGCPVTGRGGQ